MKSSITAEIARLTTYLKSLEGMVLSPTPEKHIGHPETYKQYLNRELESTKAKIDRLKAST